MHDLVRELEGKIHHERVEDRTLVRVILPLKGAGND